MKTFDSYLQEKLKNPEFKAEYDALEPEFSIMQAMIDARKESGLTQKELSEKTGISESTLSQYKGGYSKPKDKRLALLANALEVAPAWLMGLNVPMEPITDSFTIAGEAEDEQSARNKEFIELFKDADPVVQESVVNILRAAQHKS